MAKGRSKDKSNVSKQELSIGRRLRKTREAKSISLEQAHTATKIHTHILEALEEDRLGGVLDPVYVKAFLKNYAQYLGLDGPGLVREYSGQPAIRPEGAGQAAPSAPRQQRDFDRALWSIVAYTCSLLAILFIVTFAGMKIAMRIKAGLSRRPPAAETEPAPAPQTNITPARAAAPEKISIPKDAPLELIVRTVSDVWMRVKVDGKVVFYKTLPKGSRETWKANESIVLSQIGKPEALRLTLNGRSVDLSAGRKSRTIEITHEGVRFGKK